jgi:hypothetical protein
MKAILGIVLLLVVAVAGYLGWQYYAIQQAASGPAKEIVSESISKTGDMWHVKFVSKFDAPVDRVFDAYSHPERAKEFVPENVMKADVIKEDGNTKTVDLVGKLDILPPGFKVQNIRTEYTIYPDEKRISSHSIDFKLADINSEYKFEGTPDGKGTILTFNQTSKDKAPLLVDSLQKGALRETYITTVRAVSRALGLVPLAAKREAG